MRKRPNRAGICIIIFITLFFARILSGCGKQAAAQDVTAFALDTVVSVTFYRDADRAAALEALELCRDYEKVFSRTDPESELYRLNAAGTMAVSPALREVLELALECCRASGGRYDVTMGAVSALYDFSGGPHRPDDEALHEAVSHVGWEKVRLDGDTVTLGDPAAVIDLGSVAKGWIADRMKALMEERGVEHAIISLGGNILCLGGRPDGTDFQIGIQYPQRDSAALAATVRVKGESVVTSGVYERFFVEDGVTYSHLLDPATGLPLQNGLLAVSVVGPCSARCDALSTLLFALGLDEGLAYIDALDGYEAVFITEDHALHRSGGFAALEAE